MNLRTERYQDQLARWPKIGRHILAQYDADSVIVYQAYKPTIGHYAAQHGRFGGGFKLERMSWIKPNFLWMMYRSGWGTKEQQEVTLAIRMRREAFEGILRDAVHALFQPEVYGTEDAWNESLRKSPIRVQWDPDHHPNGASQQRRAIQLGLRNESLVKFASDWLLGIEDISEFVAAQRGHVEAKRYDLLVTPQEEVYPIADAALAKKLRLGE